MSPAHPLKRKSVKPSISTVRGMLPGKQFRSLDAAMQSLRTAGLRLDWRWKNAEIGWVCVGLLDDEVFCELHPVDEPLIGIVTLSKLDVERVAKSPAFPKKYKKILDMAIDVVKGSNVYEFPLEDSRHRDLFTAFVEALQEALAESED
jgi:hypothetical protein